MTTTEDDGDSKMCAPDETTSVQAVKKGEVKVAKDEKKDQKGDASAKAKSKYVDWPVRNIKEPHNNDILYGRGGE